MLPPATPNYPFERTLRLRPRSCADLSRAKSVPVEFGKEAGQIL